MFSLSFSPITSNITSYEFIAFDTEGSGAPGDFKLAAVWDEDGGHIFNDRNDLFKYIFRHKNRGKVILSANMEYDFATAFQPFPQGMRVLMANGKWIEAKYDDGKKHVYRAWDIQRIAPLSVKQMGALIGINKYSTPPLLIGGERNVEEWYCENHHRMHCVECYCLRDAEIVYKFARFFQQTLNALGGELKPTIAGVAMDLYRRKYMDYEMSGVKPIFNEHARRAYYGGRVEVYVYGTSENVRVYDFNSLYPYVMREIELGVTNDYQYTDAVSGWRKYLDKFGYMNGLFYVPKLYFPPLVYRNGDGNYFVTGEIEGSFMLSEIRELLKRGGRVMRCDGVMYANKKIKPFKRWVEDLYHLRMKYKQSGSPEEYVVKILMNSLYGKFAQRSEGGLQEVIVPQAGFDKRLYDGCYPEEMGGYEVYLKDLKTNAVPGYVNVPWAAEITAQARIALLYALENYEGDVIYTDTDSIHTTSVIGTSNELGGFKLEKQFDRGIYLAPKEYMGFGKDGEETYAVKGVPMESRKSYFLEGRTKFRRPSHMRESLRRGLSVAQWIEVEKERCFRKPRRYVLYDINPLMGRSDTRPYDCSEVV